MAYYSCDFNIDLNAISFDIRWTHLTWQVLFFWFLFIQLPAKGIDPWK
jgi:hypothetical protein